MYLMYLRFVLVYIVQAGKLSQEEAYAIAQKIGLIAVPKVERTSSLSKSTQLFNFSVYKWSKGRTVQRLILQVHVYFAMLTNTQTTCTYNNYYKQGLALLAPCCTQIQIQLLHHTTTYTHAIEVL